MQKKGVSAVVATVLIIMITIAAIGIIFGAIMPMLRDNVQITDLEIDLFIQKDTGYTVYDAEKGYVFVQVARGEDEHELKGIQVILDLDGVSHSSKVSPAPGNNNAQSYLFNVKGYGDIEGVRGSVAPVFLVNQLERIGKRTDAVDIERKDILEDVRAEIDNSDIPEYYLEIDYDCQDGEFPDPWGGCAIAAGEIYSVDHTNGPTEFDFNKAYGGWTEGIKFYENGGNCVLVNDTCYDITGGGINPLWASRPDYGYITLGVGSGLIGADTDCTGTNKFYVYESASC